MKRQQINEVIRNTAAHIYLNIVSSFHLKKNFARVHWIKFTATDCLNIGLQNVSLEPFDATLRHGIPGTKLNGLPIHIESHFQDRYISNAILLFILFQSLVDYETV